MKYFYDDTKLLDKYSAELGGVMTISDLRILLGERDNTQLYRRIKALCNKKLLTCFVRGLYVTPEFNSERLVNRLYPDSSISLTTVLAQSLVVNTVPASAVYATRSGPAHVFAGPGMSVNVLHIKPEMDFGTYVKGGIRYATPEKALLDVFYYYQFGERYPFNFRTDLNLNKINLKAFNSYLLNYRNPKFVSFVRKVIDEYPK